MRRALVVEDDPDIVELIAHYLEADGWSFEASEDGREALQRLRAGGFDLLLLHVQLPGLDGRSVCREVRGDPRTRGIPIDADRPRRRGRSHRGARAGADDYVVKPFSPKELVARVRALRRRLERPAEDADAPRRFGALEVDRTRHLARWDGRPVHLTAKEFALLEALLLARGRVLPRRFLLEQVWGYSYAEGTRTVDVHVRRLREKLPALAPALRTVKSLGYRLAAEGE